jgi:hypothetical protein
VPTHSYVNPAHERQIRDIARRKAPDLLVCISSDVLPEIKEYERTSTTVINAYVLPVVQQYCSRLRTDLNRLGVTAPLHIMQSNHRTRPLPLSPACRQCDTSLTRVKVKPQKRCCCPSPDNWSANALRSECPTIPVWTKYASIVLLFFFEDERAGIIVRALTHDPGSIAGFAETK